MSEKLAELHATSARRFLGVGAVFGLGALLLYLGLTQPFEGFAWRVLMIAMAAGAIFFGMRMQQATALHLTLTDEGVFDSSGHMLVALDDVAEVERGMLAFKPSNGFMIKAKTAKPRRWRPGLYWIAGRRIGVGGVTGAGQGKAMADIMKMKLQDMAAENAE